MKVLLVGANGYIGSALFAKLQEKGIAVTGIDNLLRPHETLHSTHFTNLSYQNADRYFLDEFTDCVWLAGHSSVTASINDTQGALRNNLFDLIAFRSLFRGRFIYASSGSVYSREDVEMATEETPSMPPSNTYDYTKICFDYFMRAANEKAVGLRFGTVNGCSTRLRSDLIINAMTASALASGELNLSNPDSYRPILWIEDLIEGVLAILASDIEDGIFNMCSFNDNIGGIAEKVSLITGATINKKPASPTYNFMMSNKLFEDTFDFEFIGDMEKIVSSLKAELI